MFEFRADVEFGVAGNLFLEDAFSGGVVEVLHAILREVVAHGAVGAAHGGVSVGVHGLVLLHLHEGGHVGAARGAEFGLGGLIDALVFHDVGVDGAEVNHERVGLLHLFGGLVEVFGVVGLVAVDGLVHAGLGEGVEVAFVFLVDVIVDAGGAVFFGQLHPEAERSGDDVLLGDVVGAFHVGAIGLEHVLLLLGGGGFFGQGGEFVGGEEHLGVHEGEVAVEEGAHGVGVGFVAGLFDLLERVAVFLLALRVGVDPLEQFGLLDGLLVGDAEVDETGVFALLVLPGVGHAGVVGGVGDADLVAGVHLFADDGQDDVAGLDDGFVLAFQQLAHLVGGHVALGAAGDAPDHGVVAVFDALETDGQRVFGFHGDVVLGVLGGAAVGCGVDAEHGEVAGMAGPYPVVGLVAELADA